MERSAESQLTVVQEIADHIARSLAKGGSIEATLKFTYPEGGAIHIDGTVAPNRVSLEDLPADCTVEMSVHIHRQLMAQEAELQAVFRHGQMKITGDLAIAMRLPSLITEPMGHRT